MTLWLQRTGQILLITAVLLLTGCTTATPAPAQPTPDATKMMQDAIQTVQAQVTETFVAQPTATATLKPTETPLPTATLTLTPTITLTNTPAFTDTPAATLTPTALPLSAKFLYSTSYPGNVREYTPNTKFGVGIGFLNTGTIPWDAEYTLKLTGFKGEATVQLEAKLGKGVKPGEKGEFNLWAYGSETLGVHIWYFQLYTDSGSPVPGGGASFSYTSK